MAHRPGIEMEYETELEELTRIFMQNAGSWMGHSKHHAYLTLLPNPNKYGITKPISPPYPASPPASPEPTVADGSDQRDSPSRSVSNVLEATDSREPDVGPNNSALDRDEDLMVLD